MLLLLVLLLSLTLSLSYISLRRVSYSNLCNVCDNAIQDVASDSVEYKSPLSQRWYRQKQRHISPNLKKVYNTNWEKYGIELEYGKKINLSEIASTISKPYTILDIGFGTGDSIVGMSAQSSDILFIGCEIYRAGIAAAMKQILEKNIVDNKIRFVRKDITYFMDFVDDNSFNEILVFFPDPWVNERDVGKRLIRKAMLDIFSRKMVSNGLLRIATDVEDYANHINKTMIDENQYILIQYMKHKAGEIFNTTSSSIYRPITKYENIAISDIHEFEYRLKKIYD